MGIVIMNADIYDIILPKKEILICSGNKKTIAIRYVEMALPMLIKIFCVQVIVPCSKEFITTEYR